jgi:hypothetical protein
VSERNEIPERLPESLAARVLERAALLDSAASRSMAVADLRSAALDAGISSAALEQALRELGSLEALQERAAPGPHGAAAPTRRPGARLARVAAMTGAATALLLAAGLFARTVNPPVLAPPAPVPEVIDVEPAPPSPPVRIEVPAR